MVDDAHQVAAEIRLKAQSLGFDLVGIAPGEKSRYGEYLQQWLAAGRHGQMTWMADRLSERQDVGAYLPGCRSVICVAVSYFAPLQPAGPGEGRVARYAQGDDYHELIKLRLYALADWLRQRVPGTRTLCGVDTVPVLERELAARTGIGWIGKNTCVINAQAGSWLLLGEVLTTLDLPSDEPALDRCGTCTRCIDACPTQALEPYRIDARRCISYLTIEMPGDVPPELRAGMGDWLFGCDICQDVCPWNRRPLTGHWLELHPRRPSGGIDARAVLEWTREQYWHATRRSALRRVKLPVLQRNAAIVQENSCGKESS